MRYGCVVTTIQADSHDAGDGSAGFSNPSWRNSSARVAGPTAVIEHAFPPALSAITATTRERWRPKSRFGHGPASFRHRCGIRFCKIRDLTSHFLLVGAKLCELGDKADRRRVDSPRDYGPLAGCAGTGRAADWGVSVGWEAW